jgi:redox-sensing transcriptional repressor
VALFDADPAKVGKEIRKGLTIRDVGEMVDFVTDHDVDIAVLAVPAAVAQQVLDQVAAAGIQAVLNFVPARLKVPEGVRIQTVDLKVQVEGLVFHLPREKDSGKEAPIEVG